MKKLIFLLLLLLFCGIGYVALRSHMDEAGKNLSLKPIAYINGNSINSILNKSNKPLNLKNALFLHTPPTQKKQSKTERIEKKHYVFEYVSVGECPQNTLAPDYLSQKMGYNVTNKNEEKRLFLPSCGLIRTKFSF